MPDWNKLVRERLGSLHIPAATQEDIVQELAAHLQDIYEENVTEGMGETRALQLALAEVKNWWPLAKNIERAKNQEGIMNARTKQLWLPALFSLFASMGLMAILQIAMSHVQTSWTYVGISLWPYAIWFLGLPIIGFMTSRVSRRAGGQGLSSLIAAAFPSIVMSVLWLAILVSVLLWRSPRPLHVIPNFFLALFLWAVLPGMALLLGTVPLPKRQKISA